MRDLLAEQWLYDQALISYQQAESLYAQSPVNAIEKQVRCLSATGRMFLLSGQQESAFADMHPGLSSFTRSTYPQFTETEFKVCLLSYAGLPSKEIALLINQSVHTVNMSRTRIRQKMDLKEAGADFCAHLKERFS